MRVLVHNLPKPDNGIVRSLITGVSRVRLPVCSIDSRHTSYEKANLVLVEDVEQVSRNYLEETFEETLTLLSDGFDRFKVSEEVDILFYIISSDSDVFSSLYKGNTLLPTEFELFSSKSEFQVFHACHGDQVLQIPKFLVRMYC